ncbi:MAG: tetratricopeptide repeat protein [Vulcanimicrobiota bacterium]
MRFSTVISLLLAIAFIFSLSSVLYAENAQSLYIQGVECIKDKDYKKAIGYFEQAIKLNKAYVKAYVGKGICSFMMDNHRKALDDLNKAVQLDPENVTALFWRGTTYLMLGESKNAIPDFTGVLRKQPENSASYLFRGICHFRLDNLTETISDVSKSISFNPRKADPYIVRGMSYFKKEKYDSAVRDLTRGVELEPNNAYYQLLAYTAKARGGDMSKDSISAFYEKNHSDNDALDVMMIGMMIGKVAPDVVLKAAAKFEPEHLRGTMIQQAQFFVGNLFYLQGDKEKGKKYIDLAMNGENRLFVIQAIVKIGYYDFKGLE